VLALEMFVHKYSPIQHVKQISCPILFVAATQDVLCPVDQVHRALALAPNAQLLSRECTHFELYRGQLFEGLIHEQARFFQQHTGLLPVQNGKRAS
jgi:pimeloyl-ACP methyl ester carboxylesterase